MEHGFSIIMLIFAGMILLMALAIYKGGYDLIFRNYATNPRNKKLYAKQFAKLLMLTAAAPLLAGLLGFLSNLLGAIVLIVGMVLCIYFGIRLTHITELLEREDKKDDE